MSRARVLTKLAWRVVAVAALALIAYPPGSTAIVNWVAAHDHVDVPYVRDCHGIFRRPVEGPGATEARER